MFCEEKQVTIIYKVLLFTNNKIIFIGRLKYIEDVTGLPNYFLTYYEIMMTYCFLTSFPALRPDIKKNRREHVSPSRDNQRKPTHLQIYRR